MLEKIQQDVHDARVLIEESGSPDEIKRYRRAAEIILLKILRAQPEHEEAKALLQCALAAQGRPKAERQPESAPAVVAAPLPVSVPAPISASVKAPAVHAKDDIPFTVAAPVSPKKEKKQRRLTLMLPFGVIALVLLGGGLRMFERWRSSDPVPAYAATTIPQMQYVSRTEVPPPLPQPAAVTAEPIVMRVETPPVNVTTPAETKAIQPMPAAPRQKTVQINAKPWAQVFLDGSTRRMLGQTPLSGVAVPVGGVLVFENPDFATKSHRITERDSAIQVEFP